MEQIGIDRAESEGYFLSEGQEGVTESELEQSGFREVFYEEESDDWHCHCVGAVRWLFYRFGVLEKRYLVADAGKRIKIIYDKKQKRKGADAT